MGPQVHDPRGQATGSSPATAPRRPLARPAWRLLLAAALTAALVALAHWPVLDSRALALDDTLLVTDNPLVTRPSWTSAGRFFSEVLRPSTVSAYYLPLSMTSLMVDYALGGRADDLRVFHRTNLALHVLSAVLVLLILYRLFGALVPAAVVALMFGLHPLTVEPTASIGERKTLLAAFFGFACVLSYLQYARRGGRAWWAATVALFVLALLSKPSVSSLPLVLILLDYWPLRRLSWSTVVEKWPLALLSLVFVALSALAVVRSWELGPPPPPSSFIEPFLQVGYLLAFYLGKIVWPANLSCIYPPPEWTLDDRVVLLSLAVVSGLILLLVLSSRRTRGPLVGSLVFVVALAPTFAILRWSSIIAYDRYVYFPLLGILLILGAGLTAAWRSRPLRSPAMRAVVLSLLLAVTAAEALGIRATLSRWRDSLTLWRHIEALAPGVPEAHDGLGVALAAQSAHAEAIQEFRRATEIDPGYPFAQLNLGTLLSHSGRPEEAIPHLRRACALMPGSPNAGLQLGIAAQHAGRLQEAEAEFRRVLEIRPGYIDAVDHLGIVLVLQGRADEGIAMIRSALELAPDDARPPYSLALALMRTGGHDAEALDLLRRAIQSKPEWVAPYDELAWLLATHADSTLRDPAEAMRLADRAVELTRGRDASVLDTQAAARAAAGRFDQAVESARRALALQGFGDPPPEAIRARLAMYQRGIAYVEPAVDNPAPILR